jgi:thiosulfate/3-mercaptopyruvate sulfurtransferase
MRHHHQKEYRIVLPLLLEPAALGEHLGDENILIIDLCNTELYQQVHLPGAIHVTPQELVSGIAPAVGKLPSLARLQAFFNRIGYDSDKHIIVYDDEGGGWAGRFIWTLDVIGHDKMSYLDGGMHAWLAEKLPVSNEINETTPTNINLTIDHAYIASQQDILDSLDKHDTDIWDARSALEYTGQRQSSARSGHIPGAINLDWMDTMDRARNFRIRADIKQVLASHGISGNKPIITHCQTHHRSGLTYLIGKILGFDIRAYDGSWAEWGNDPTTPIETS